MDKELEKGERLPFSISAAVFIEDEQGRLLFVQQATPIKEFKWGPPAGGIRSHEDPLKAAKREVKEELAIDIELKNLIGIYTVDRGDKASGMGFVFRGKIVSGHLTPHEEEIKSFKYFTPSEINDLILQNKLYKPEYNLLCIQDWLEGKAFDLEVINNL